MSSYVKAFTLVVHLRPLPSSWEPLRRLSASSAGVSVGPPRRSLRALSAVWSAPVRIGALRAVLRACERSA